MDVRSVFDPAFRAYGQLVPGFDTEALEQALRAHPQPEQGVVYESKLPGGPLRDTAAMLGGWLFDGRPARLGIYSGKLSNPRRLLRQRRGVWLIGGCDFLLPVTSQEEVRRRRLADEQLAVFRVPAGVLVRLFGTTLHCVPCHTHDRDGMNVLMLCPAGPLQKTAEKGKQVLRDRLPNRFRAADRPAERPPVPVRITKPPKSEDEGEEPGPKLTRENLRRVRRAANPRRLYSSARWRTHVAARLKPPTGDDD